MNYADLITLEKITLDTFSAHWNMRVYIGEIFKALDGKYVWLPNPHRKGYWVSGQLKAISDRLDELNAPILEQESKELRKELTCEPNFENLRTV